jgi:hypothetical protein
VAKAKNHKPAKRRRKTKVARTTETPARPESAKELAERTAAEWVKSNPGLVEQLKRAVEFVQKHKPVPQSEAERAERAEAQKTIRRYIAIRDNQTPPPWVASKTEMPNSRTSTESNSPATVSETKTATNKWVTDEAQRMKAADEIPTEIKITHFAQQLAGRMAAAACNDPSIRPVTWRYIKNELPSWDLWPISKI